MIKNKKILLGVTGSIAAYKSAFLVRLLVKAGAEVKVIMSQSATDFVAPLTLSTLSKNPVLIDFQKDKTGEWNNHVELGLWADVMLIAPASANTIAKMANGLCDNLLLATYLSARCPIFLCPAMDLDMLAHPSTLHNLQKLQEFGNHVIEPKEGELASGLFGKGRMAEPEEIVVSLEHFFESQKQAKKLHGKKALITAGATREYIDPVRFISNNSSGKMGYAIAEELAAQGAAVTLISGKTYLSIQNSHIHKINVETAAEMFEATVAHVADNDIIVHCAAVADYTPKEKASQKIKKKENDLTIELVKTKDIAKEVGHLLQPHQFHVGFALETNEEIKNAKEKLQKKNFDMIILNSLQDKGAGFEHDTNKVSIIDKTGQIIDLPLKSKKEVAQDIVRLIVSKLPKT
ncbi:bifunctional phosphopantothenoylcysteine decarboxylase/phosphopantothenate--cysteine ligase CoaBC [Thermoflexibacter ruber]|uniref:Coenzyme A biosynthesis bifunctional protein CoaBC n=1 Tax=Thermoflexibacter ruber TaxID=1003 RepID=A0A1I2B5I7_9BACT|nr:bifunctional phosphopantothenoylcysteine decarboxylase/phosphopantothenate--cysteine ligase CoaBC [Thermoflexibacter ruber]SFE50563.1 Phosphopantothenate-cysteine ligase /Phosphopantothenoylcysteine decarboxylase [Thermoflexibacter ruber]